MCGEVSRAVDYPTGGRRFVHLYVMCCSLIIAQTNLINFHGCEPLLCNKSGVWHQSCFSCGRNLLGNIHVVYTS